MDSKKSIKISLSTFVLTIIILILLIIIFGMWYYYNNMTDKPVVENSVAKNSIAVDNNIPSNTQEETTFKLGTYIIQVSEELIDDSGYIPSDEDITFFEDKTFKAYTGFGNGISGKYTISKDKINCIADSFDSEYGPKQKINATISFKINTDSQIEIVEVSDSYVINVVDLVNNSLTDETKDMPLWPFLEGIKFNLSK